MSEFRSDSNLGSLKLLGRGYMRPSSYSLSRLIVKKLLLLALVIGGVLLLVYLFGPGNSNTVNMDNQANSPLGSQGAASPGPASGSENSKEPSRPNGQSENSSKTSVTVNGKSVEVPQSGTYSKTVETPGGRVSVSGENSQSTTGANASNSSSTTVNIQSP